MKAKLIKDLGIGRRGIHQKLYEMNPPHEGHAFVIASAATLPWVGAETYLFAADENGEITNWTELDGSFRGALDHAQALRNAGYEVTE